MRSWSSSSNTLKTASGETRALLDARYSFLLSERESYVTKLNDLVRPEDVQGGRVLRLPPSIPGSPSSPLHIRDGLVGLIVGLALGIGVALVRGTTWTNGSEGVRSWSPMREPRCLASSHTPGARIRNRPSR